MIRLWFLGLALFGLTMAALSLHVPGALSIGTLTLKSWFVAITGVSAAVYVAAILAIIHGPASRAGIWFVLLVAAALRVPLIVSPPFLSTDVYRYVWDGRVQAAGINPYRYFPGDPVLTTLRDRTVYPKINRAEYAPTIYPPMAQVIFAASGVLWSSVTGVKATMAAFEVLAVICLLRLLTAAGLPKERVAIYAWNPLPVWAFAGDGHIDAAVTGLVAAALLLQVRHRNTWAGAVLGLAIVTKFLPAVVAPILWRRRTGWRTAAACLATVTALYALYGSVGLRIFGFLNGYGSEEGYDSGEGFWLLAGLGRLMKPPAFATTLYKVSPSLSWLPPPPGSPSSAAPMNRWRSAPRPGS